MKFFDQLKLVDSDKAEFFRDCNPLMYTSFKIDGKFQGFNTNIRFDYKNKESRLLIRKPEKRALFE
jgi:hypothetical protein